jgi:ubiquinone/menaquinone biosynthesis C-methylase UbiE
MADGKPDTSVSDSYDRNAQAYFDLVGRETQHASVDRACLRLFAELVGPAMVTLDAGCGPGHIAAFLGFHGLRISGVDSSPAMIELAQASFPDIVFRVGELADLPIGDSSVDAVVSRHSVIHTEPQHLDAVFSEFARVLAPGGRLFLSFFAAPNAAEHGRPFDHAVCTAYRLDPSTISALLSSHGFDEEVRVVRQPRPEERQMPHATLFARYTGALPRFEEPPGSARQGRPRRRTVGAMRARPSQSETSTGSNRT